MRNNEIDPRPKGTTAVDRRLVAMRRWLFGQADRRMLLIVGIVAVVVVAVLVWAG